MSKKMKQRTLFGGVAKDCTKLYCVYKNPDGDFESVVERFCLRERKKSGRENKILVPQAHAFWKEIKGDEAKIKDFLQLRPGKKPFVRSSIFCFSIFSVGIYPDYLFYKNCSKQTRALTTNLKINSGF